MPRSNLYEIIRSENVYSVSKSSQERGSGLAGEFYTSDEIDTILEDYYTESELQTSGQSSVHWNNLTNVIDPVITLTGDITGSGTMVNLTSVSFATSITADAVKSSDIDWGTGVDQVDLDEVPDGSTYNRVQSSELVAGIYKDATTAVKGIASFSNSDFTVSSGAVSIKPGVITPALHASTHTSGGSDPVNHNTLTDFVADEHIDHSTVTFTAGNGLTGGGTIASSRTFDIGSGTGITVNVNSIQTNDSQIVHASLSGYTGDEHVDHTSVTIVAGSGLTGGGDITIPRTINVGAGAGIGLTANTVYVLADYTLISSNDAATDITGAELEELTDGSTTVLHTHSGVSPSAHASSHESGGGDLVDHDNLTNFVSNEHIDHSAVSIIAGTGLNGGGTIESTRTINMILSAAGGENGSDDWAARKDHYHLIKTYNGYAGDGIVGYAGSQDLDNFKVIFGRKTVVADATVFDLATFTCSTAPSTSDYGTFAGTLDILFKGRDSTGGGFYQIEHRRYFILIAPESAGGTLNFSLAVIGGTEYSNSVITVNNPSEKAGATTTSVTIETSITHANWTVGEAQAMWWIQGGALCQTANKQINVTAPIT